ncbi:MAG: hypothetical protein GYA50_05385 [Eubacteriaceae bacterium]|nr:hypothetical protein [Eubacteriaceae bacterium]
MEKIFDDYGIEIIKNEDKYIIKVDSGGLLSKIDEIEVSEEDGIKAQQGPQMATEVLIKYKNLKRHNK